MNFISEVIDSSAPPSVDVSEGLTYYERKKKHVLLLQSQKEKKSYPLKTHATCNFSQGR